MQNVHLVPCAQGLLSVDNDAHGNENLLLNFQINKDFAYYYESTNIIYHTKPVIVLHHCANSCDGAEESITDMWIICLS